MTKVPSQDAAWRKSTYSNSGTNCVEINMRVADGVQAIRDSKNPDGGRLSFPRSAVAAFFDQVKRDGMG